MVKHLKVLLVDGEKQFLIYTKTILLQRGFEVILAESGEKAIEKLKKKPDVVVLDIKMQGMNGYDTLKEIKKQAHDMPVIMLTGDETLSTIQKAHKKGAIDFLVKPCDMNLLCAKIRNACYKEEKHPEHEEKRILGVMVPLQEYSVINEEITIMEAIIKLRDTFVRGISSNRIMETAHHTMLVVDKYNNVQGILTIKGLLKTIMPLSDKNNILLQKGIFRKEIRKKAKMKIKDVMSPAPLTIECTSSLMEAVYLMLRHNTRRLLVLLDGKLVGIIREQDLFFEMEKILMG